MGLVGLVETLPLDGDVKRSIGEKSGWKKISQSSSDQYYVYEIWNISMVF